ncbi:MAG TPA: hypothetical protein DD001_15245 [Microcoleaceae bacterium UBA10368]|nr:hypothetical protein [Microcoleaceae cyanobacterium UBA10368]HCV32314.1 hypothetical protein [Microcoleaceae cyanobacterium UBA9251]
MFEYWSQVNDTAVGGFVVNEPTGNSVQTLNLGEFDICLGFLELCQQSGRSATIITVQSLDCRLTRT